MRLTPFFKSDQMITCSVLLEGTDEELFCSFIYASNFVEDRKSMWEDLRNHHDYPMFHRKLWMINRDFNEILTREDHSNNIDSPSTLGMRNFQDMVRYCSILDLGYHGSLFTWCNKKEMDSYIKLWIECWQTIDG